MIKEKKQRKLAFIIIAIVASVIIALNVIQITFIARTTNNTITKNYEEECRELTKAYSEKIAGKVIEYQWLLSAYTSADAVLHGTNAQIIKWLQDHEHIRNKEFDYVAWVDADGNFDSDIKTHTNVKDRQYFKDIMELGMDLTVDEPVTSKTSGKTVIHICRAAKRDNKTIGFFCAVMETHSIHNFVKDIHLGETGIANLLTLKGDIIATSGDFEKLKADLEVINNNPQLMEKIRILAESDDDILSFWTTNSHGKKIFMTSRNVSGTPWGFSFMIDSSQVFKTANYLRIIMIIAGCIVGAVLSLIVGFFVYHSLKPLTVVQGTINSIADGNADLTKRIDVAKNANNEIGDVVRSFNKFSEKLQEIIHAVKLSKDELMASGQSMQAVSQETTSVITEISANIQNMGNNINSQTACVSETAGAVNQIAANIESLNQMISSQSSSVMQASSAVEQMIVNINAVSSSIDKMAESFTRLEANTEIGVNKQADVNNRIQEIQLESNTLQEANTVISTIANQTNLLAMNAAIEAAHAGDAGKGFAVVADEIRKLSETSTVQSKRIKEQLKKIAQTITGVVQASNETGKAFSDISGGINETDNLVRQIKAAMEEQSAGSKQITQALSEMNNSTSEVKTASFEMSEGNKAILEEIRQLQDASLSMKEGMEEMRIGAEKINETSSSLGTITREVEESIRKIGGQVDLFKV